MDRRRSTAFATVALFTTAMALLAVTGAGAAQPTPVGDCTTINESGAYEFNQTIDASNLTADANESAVSTDGTPAATETATPAETDSPETPATHPDSDSRSCIVIAADDVVLDGNGTVLDGNVTELADEGDANGTATVIESNETETATTQNATTLVGITVRPAPGETEVSNVTIRNLTVRHWNVGVSSLSVHNLSLDNVTVTDNADADVRFGRAPGPTTPVPTANESAADEPSPTATDAAA